METRLRLADLRVTDANMKSKRDDIAALISKEKFISRSVISASFSLVEAFLSGLFFAARNTKALGRRCCDETFLAYAEGNERKAAFKERLDRIVRFASGGTTDGGSEPFKSYIETKRYCDAIHHTTPFAWKDLEAGQQLLSLYEIKSDVAALCVPLPLDCVLALSSWIYSDEEGSEIAERCKKLREKIGPWQKQHHQR